MNQKLTAPIRPASNSFLGFFWSPVCFLLPGTGASLTLVSSWDPPFRKGFCLVAAAGEAAEEAEVVADESAMGAEGKLGLVFWAHQSLSPLGPLACKEMIYHSCMHSTGLLTRQVKADKACLILHCKCPNPDWIIHFHANLQPKGLAVNCNCDLFVLLRRHALLPHQSKCSMSA